MTSFDTLTRDNSSRTSGGSLLASNRLPRGTAWVVLAIALAVSFALFGLLAAANGSALSVPGARSNCS